MNQPVPPTSKPARRKRWISHLIRVSICVLALWFVVRGVSWNDRVWVRATGDGAASEMLAGRIAKEEKEKIEFVSISGETRVIPSSDIAADAKGTPRIEYGLRSSLENSNKSGLWLALAIQFPVAVLLGVRLRWLLLAQSIRISLWDGVKMSYAGNFLNFAAPLGSNAGDVFKAFFVSLHTHRKTEAMTTIALDRALGLGTLILVVALITLFSPGGNPLAAFRNHMLLLLALGLAGVIVYASSWPRKLIPGSLKGRESALFDQVRRIDRAALDLLRKPAIVLAAVGLTVALQVLAIGSYVIAAHAMGLSVQPGNVHEFFAYYYLGAVVQSLPGPPQGLGTVELAYRYFFSPYGSVSQILCMAFVIRLLVLVCALPGALVAMTGAYRPKNTGDSENEPTLDSQTVESSR